MNKNTLLIWVDAGLFVLLGVTLLTVGPEVFSHAFLHVFSGILLMIGAALHIGLHWSWIKNAFARLDRLPPQARANAWLDLALFCAYIVCGGVGLIARSLLIFLPLHIFLGVIHVLLAVPVVVLQIIHIARHWKWMTAAVRRMFA